MCWLQRETEEYKSSHQPRDSGRERAGELGGPRERGGARRRLAPTCHRAEGLEAAVVRPGVQREAEVLQGVEEAEEDGECARSGQAPRNGRRNHCPVAWLCQAVPTTHLKRGGFVSCKATELSDAILEGYPKSKKQFFVSGSLPRPHSPGRSIRGGLIHLSPCPRRKSG